MSLMTEEEKYRCSWKNHFLQNKIFYKNTKRIKNVFNINLQEVVNILGGWHKICPISWTKSKMYSLKVQGELLGLFFYYTLEWICPYMFLPQVSSLWHHRTSGYRKLSILRAPVLQWNKHPTQFHLKK